MADTTTINALPMPQLADRANIETAVRPLAQAVDTRLVARFGTLAARNSAISSPVAGEVCWVTETKELYIYEGSAWVSVRPRCVRILTGEVYTSVTPVASSYLTHTVESFSAYTFRYWGSWTAAVDQIGIQADYIVPSGATLVHGGVGPTQDSTNVLNTTVTMAAAFNNSPALKIGLDAAVRNAVIIEGFIATGATGGSLTATFAHAYTGHSGQAISMGAGILEIMKVA